MEIDLAVKEEAKRTEGKEAVARMLELRQGNILPAGVSIQDMIRDGRDG